MSFRRRNAGARRAFKVRRLKAQLRDLDTQHEREWEAVLWLSGGIGTCEDFERLTEEAEKRALKVKHRIFACEDLLRAAAGKAKKPPIRFTRTNR